MPDVGVLQLRISADAKSASASLRTLQTRLSEINTIAQNFNMSNIANQIGSIVKQVSANSATSTAVRNLGSLLNAISSFSKVTKIGLNKSQIEQIGALQQAVSGFNLGNSGTQLNKLREALGGEWNTDQAAKAREALETLSHGAKAISESGASEKIKDVSKSLGQMTGGASNEIKAVSTEMQQLGQTSGTTADTLERIGKLNNSVFGRIPGHFMSMQGSVLNETAGFADSVSQVKEVSVVAKDATTEMQSLKVAAEETASSIENIDITKMTQEIEQAAEYMGLADKDIASGIEEANSRLEEQIQLRREALEAENQARLEKNYENYRELFLSKEGEWEKQVPEMYGFTPKALEEGETYAEAMKITMQEVNEYVDEFIDKMNSPTGTLLRDSIDGMLGIGNAAKNAEESAQLLKNVPEVKESTQEVQTAVSGMANTMTKSQTATRMLGENLKDLDVELKEKKSDIKDVSNETQNMKKSFSEMMIGSEGLGGSFKRMFPALSGILNRFKNLVKYRMLRAVIKHISEGFREGTENYYKYSEAIGGSFAPAMDSAVSSLAQMKNSIGAAAAPVIQALIPYLQMAVNWFITAINYANQFFALLGGQTSWSRAVPQTAKAFDNVKKSAGGAGSAIKDLLADWDELNIIQSESGGGGGGGGAAAMEDYLNMFEESSVFDEKIKKITDFVRENFDEILDIIKKIGAALLLWKFSSAFTGLLGTLSGLVAAGLVGAIVFEVSTLFTNQYLKTGDIGWMIADLLSTLLGSYFMKKILTKVLGGEVAKLAIPITFTISAVAGIVTLLGNNDVSALSEEALIASAENGLKAAFAAGYLLKNFGGYTLAQSAGGGLGIGITTFGLVIGLKAVADTLDTREFTSEIIKADFLSAGLVGTGIAITELALGGGAVAALTLGGGAALLTLGALFAIEALLVLSEEEDPIKWGDYKATEEEIKAFVDEEIFSGEPKVKISLAKATIEPLGENKTKLEESAATVIGTLQAVRLGLSTSAEADLRSDLETFISTFDATSKNYQDALKVSVSLVPIGGTADGGQEIVNNSESRWGELNGLMKGLADDLTKQFDIAYNSDLDEVTRKNAELSIEKISSMMTQIADAVASGQAQAKIAHNINTQIENMTQDSMDSMLAYYGEQRDSLIEELVSVGNDAAEGVLAQYYAYERLAEYALKEANGNIEDATYKHYIEQANAAYADYESRLAQLKENAEEAADKTLGNTEGFKKIRKTLLEKLTKSVPTDIEELLASGGVGDINIYKAFIERMLGNIADGQEDSSSLKTEMEDLFWGMIYDLVGGENIDTYRDAIEKGIITYADLFGDVDIGSILTEAFGIAGMSPEIQAAWEDIINSLFPDKPISLSEKPILIDKESLKDSLIAGVESVGSVAISPEIILENPSIEESKEHEEAIKEKIRESLRGIEIGRNDAEFDAIQSELVGKYGVDLVESVMDEFESGMYDTELPEIDLTQPVTIDLETEQINSDIGNAITNVLTGFSSAFNFDDMSGTLTNAYEIAQQKLASMYGGGGGGGMPFAGFPSDIAITEKRDSGEEIGNTAEGTRQGTSELVTGQNTMNGYMQQVAMSTAGMVDSQGTANSYMAQMVSLLRAIASQGGGGPMAPSVAGGMIAGAMKAFDMIRG